MSKKNIYIHIGTPKTGTTSIQGFLTRNVEMLLEAGVFYPIAGRYYPSSTNIEQEGCKGLDLCVNGGVVNEQKQLSKVLEDFSNSGSDTMLLSEECLFQQSGNSSFVNNAEIWGMLSGYEVKIIIYLRNSVEYLCSLWQECMKLRHQMELLEFLEGGDYLRHLENLYALSEIIGVENFIVKTFEKEMWVNNSLIEDFLSILNVNYSKRFQAAKTVDNVGLSRDKCDRLLYVNRGLGMDAGAQDHYDVNSKITPCDEQKVIDSLPDELIKNIADKYYPEECKIAEYFLNRERLFKTKYPKIYNQKRNPYKENISMEDKEELRFIVNSTLKRQIINNQQELISLNSQLLNKVSSYIVQKEKVSCFLKIKKVTKLLLSFFYIKK